MFHCAFFRTSSISAVSILPYRYSMTLSASCGRHSLKNSSTFSLTASLISGQGRPSFCSVSAMTLTAATSVRPFSVSVKSAVRFFAIYARCDGISALLYLPFAARKPIYSLSHSLSDLSIISSTLQHSRRTAVSAISFVLFAASSVNFASIFLSKRAASPSAR